MFCDASGERLRHRWGSGKLYRGYYQDYRKFLSRPEVVAESIQDRDGARIVIVHSDLRQFYDRVRPALLARKVEALAGPTDDERFYSLAARILHWEWSSKDVAEVVRYAEQAELGDFSRVALPQGLVAAGFFANVALLDFDQGLREMLSRDIAPGIRVEDVCRYVDDLRLVLVVDSDRKLREIEEVVVSWLQSLLDGHAGGLQAAEEKTKAAAFRGDERPLVRQSRKMERIQGAVSGGFDAIGGEEILEAIQGLIRSQQRYSEQRTEAQGWRYSPVPDVRDPTVARFAAGRFRSTYRSLRPLLEDGAGSPVSIERGARDSSTDRARITRTQVDLDDDARAFALGLIENWVGDPSNVRLLRIGLDLWPAEDLLTSVLALLRPFTESIRLAYLATWKSQGPADGLRGEDCRPKVRIPYFWECSVMLAKLTAKNQLTLPKGITNALGPVEYFDVEIRNGQVILTPVRIQRADAVRAKLAELGLTEEDVSDAVAWARKPDKGATRKRRG